LKQAPSTAHSVLIVDDDRNLTVFLSTVLSLEGHQVTTASDGESALQLLKDRQIDVIVLDLRMPRMDGRAFYRELRARGDQTPVLIASAYGALDAQRELGAEGAVEKPFSPETLAQAIRDVLAQS
jgi:DNA-binding response OmpR family regulator